MEKNKLERAFIKAYSMALEVSRDVDDELKQLFEIGQNNPLSYEEKKEIFVSLAEKIIKRAKKRGDEKIINSVSSQLNKLVDSLKDDRVPDISGS